MKLGIVTPALTLLPRAHAQWEETADVATIVDIVREAERLGYHHCTCSEHVAVPVDVAEVRGGRYWDPLAIFGYLAAVTEQIKLATHVLVLGYHHPLADREAVRHARRRLGWSPDPRRGCGITA